MRIVFSLWMFFSFIIFSFSNSRKSEFAFSEAGILKKNETTNFFSCTSVFTSDFDGDSIKNLRTQYEKIINEIYPTMNVVEFRKAYPGIIPDSTSYNSFFFNNYLSLDTFYYGRKARIDFVVENNLVTRLRFNFPSQSISWYKGQKVYKENLDLAEKTFEYCKSTAEIFAKQLGKPSYSQMVNSIRCVDFTIELSESLFKQEWNDQDQSSAISLYYSSEHWQDSLTADTCSQAFSRQKIYDTYKGEYEFAHDLNSDGPQHDINLAIMISGKNQNPVFPFLSGVNVNMLNKYIAGFNKSVNHTQGKWHSKTKVGEIDMSTQFEFKKDTLTSVVLEWNKYDHVFRQDHISYRVADTLTSEFGKALNSFEILTRHTEKMYGKPVYSDLVDKNQIASFNINGGGKSIRQDWILDDFIIVLELDIYSQMKTTYRSSLKYSMIKRNGNQ